MRNHLKPKIALLLLIIVSVSSSLFLQQQSTSPMVQFEDLGIVQACIQESSYLIDVKIIKILIQSVFNIVNA
ncbi:MAG: hypothetical protein WAU01_00820 [Saprospiraceae bacterium]